MSGPVNSPVGDDLPYQLPKIDNQTAKKAVPKSDWNKLGNSRKYPNIDKYIEVRMEYWRHFLPGGTALRDMVAEGKYEEAGRWAAVASAIVDEFDNFKLKIQTEKTK